MTSSDDASYRRSIPDTPRPLNVLEDAWLLQDVQAWRVEEHHLRLDALLHSTTTTMIGGLEVGHPLNAHVPMDLEVVSNGPAKVWSTEGARWMEGIVVRSRGSGGKELFYE